MDDVPLYIICTYIYIYYILYIYIYIYIILYIYKFYTNTTRYSLTLSEKPCHSASLTHLQPLLDQPRW